MENEKWQKDEHVLHLYGVSWGLKMQFIGNGTMRATERSLAGSHLSLSWAAVFIQGRQWERGRDEEEASPPFFFLVEGDLLYLNLSSFGFSFFAWYTLFGVCSATARRKLPNVVHLLIILVSLQDIKERLLNVTAAVIQIDPLMWSGTLYGSFALFPGYLWSFMGAAMIFLMSPFIHLSSVYTEF